MEFRSFEFFTIFQKSTKEQMDKAGAMMRSVCQPKFKVPDDVADNIKNGQFPEDKNAKV